MTIENLTNDPLTPSEKKALALVLSINVIVLFMGTVANLLFFIWLLPGMFTMRVNTLELAALVQQHGVRAALPVCSRMVIYMTLYPILWVLHACQK